MNTPLNPETINNQAQYNAYFNTFQHLCYTARHYRSLINPATPPPPDLLLELIDGVDKQRKYFTKKAEQLENKAEAIRLKLIEYEEREPEY